MIQVILWDIDGTLLNFLAAERAAMRGCFAQFHMGELSDGQIARYSAVNTRYWQALERGELTKPQVLVGRFEEFFAAEGLDPALAVPFNEAYQLRLGDTICFQDDAYPLVQSLRGRVRQYAATNGTLTAQTRKLEKSGLGDLLDGAFISDQIGAEKPSPAFFDYALSHIGSCPREQVLMVGDSLTSDMRGGSLAGIRCCWYNPAGAPKPAGLHLDAVIQNLNQVPALLDVL